MRSESEVAAMACPVCRVPLSMSERSGIEIDYCPQCRGVWLDRGELDKIVERSAAEPPDSPPAPSNRPQPGAPPQDPWGAGGYGHGGYGHGGSHGKSYRKRKSFLSELFD